MTGTGRPDRPRALRVAAARQKPIDPYHISLPEPCASYVAACSNAPAASRKHWPSGTAACSGRLATPKNTPTTAARRRHANHFQKLSLCLLNGIAVRLFHSPDVPELRRLIRGRSSPGSPSLRRRGWPRRSVRDPLFARCTRAASAGRRRPGTACRRHRRPTVPGRGG